MVRSLCDSVCPFAIETTFPLSNFKTKHIFGILMILRKFLKLWAPQAHSKRGAVGAQIFFFSFTAAEGTASPEGKRNPAEGWCYAIIYLIQ